MSFSASVFVTLPSGFSVYLSPIHPGLTPVESGRYVGKVTKKALSFMKGLLQASAPSPLLLPLSSADAWRRPCFPRRARPSGPPGAPEAAVELGGRC